MSDIDLEAAAAAIALDFTMAVRNYGLSDGRTLQSKAGIIGPSDLGFCRQRAALMIRIRDQLDKEADVYGMDIARYGAYLLSCITAVEFFH